MRIHMITKIKRPHYLIILCFIFIPITTGCVSLKQPSHKIDYYTFDYDSPTTQNNKQQLPVIIKIKKFSISPEFNTSRMLYKESANSIAAYNYHRWQANPADLVTYYLSRDLQASGNYQAVLPPTGQALASHYLEGSVNQFLESDIGSWHAKISVTITIIRTKEPDVSKRIYFQKTFSAQTKCITKTPQAVALAMSQSMATISDQINQKIYAALQ